VTGRYVFHDILNDFNRYWREDDQAEIYATPDGQYYLHTPPEEWEAYSLWRCTALGPEGQYEPQENATGTATVALE